MSAIYSFHPILKHFSTLFRAEYPLHQHSRIGTNLSLEKIPKEWDMHAASVMFGGVAKVVLSKCMTMTGLKNGKPAPGASFFAAKEVHLEAPDITLKGSPKEPVVVFSLDDLTVKAELLKTHDVYFLTEKKIQFSAPSWSIYRTYYIKLEIEDGQITGEVHDLEQMVNTPNPVDKKKINIDATLFPKTWETMHPACKNTPFYHADEPNFEFIHPACIIPPDETKPSPSSTG